MELVGAAASLLGFQLQAVLEALEILNSERSAQNALGVF